jgi:peptide deformylase
MIRPIYRMGNPILRRRAREVSKDFLLSDQFGQLLRDLKDSMKHYGGIGIAAPQIGVDLQVAIIELKGLNRYGEDLDLPLQVFVNPTLAPLTAETQGYWEGCLSVPGLRGYVERPAEVRVSYLDERGVPRELEARGFLATVLQHELDHLHGVLYVDRITDPRLLAFQEEFEQFIQERTLE